MAKLIKKRTQKKGSPPGSLIFVGKRRTSKVTIDLIKYNVESCERIEDIPIGKVPEYRDDASIIWLNITGLHQTEIIAAIGAMFNIHPLIIEDILNPDQRPKMDIGENHIIFFLKMLQLNPKSKLVQSEQTAIVMGQNYLLSFQEAEGDVFDTIRDRLITASTNIRKLGTDYLAFALMDSIVDNYIFAIEQLGGEVELLVDDLLNSQDNTLLAKVNVYRREINLYRRIVRPAMEMIYMFEKSESPLIMKKTNPFLRDLGDHIQHANDAVEIYKELLNEELGIFHMNMGARLNDILRTLTIFSVVFIPLTFVAGVYGTNFDNLPEIHYKYGYFLFWVALIIIAAGMLYYFKRKKWL